MSVLTPASIAPVEYAVAVDRYLLSEAELSPASRRVYRDIARGLGLAARRQAAA